MDSKRFFRLIAFSLFAIICFGQCYIILTNYFDYPRAVQTNEIGFNSILDALPGFTICNNNRLSFKKLLAMDKSATFKQYKYLLERQARVSNENDLFEFRKELRNIYTTLNFDTQDYINNLSMNDLIESAPISDEFISKVQCMPAWVNSSLSCDLISRIQTIQDRHCTTLFSLNSIIHDTQSTLNFKNQSEEMMAFSKFETTNNTNKDDSSLNMFGPIFNYRDTLRFLINFEPSDYADLKRQIGARIHIHDSALIPSQMNVAFFVTRGFEYTIDLRRLDTILFNHLNCHDYLHEDNFKSILEYKDDKPKRLRVVISRTTCEQNCIASRVASKMNCWPPFVPYIKNDIYDPFANKTKCKWYINFETTLILNSIKYSSKIRANPTQNFTIPEPLNETYRILYNEVRKIKLFCMHECKIPCKIIKYDHILHKVKWPSDIKLHFSKNDDKSTKDNYIKLRHCCAIINVRFPRFTFELQQYSFKYNLVDTIGNIGGLLAVWLGVSILSLARAVERLLEFATKSKQVSPTSK